MRLHGLLLVLLVATPAAAFALPAPEDGWARLSQPGPYGVRAPTVHVLESRIDGADIQVGVVRPATPPHVKVPILVRASPYLPDLTPESMRNEFEYAMRAQFVPHGYALAYIATRGSGGSGGCGELMSPRERDDISQAITWLAKRPWSNGNVGVVGISYDGTTAWMAAASGNPHVKTIVPVSSFADAWGDYHRNGTSGYGAHVNNDGNFYWGFGFAYETPFFAPNTGRSLEQRIDGAACEEYVEGALANVENAEDGRRSAYFEERDHRADVLARYRGSVLLVHGLEDARVSPRLGVPLGWALEERGVEMKWLLGQWGHAFPDVAPGGPPATAPAHDHSRRDWADLQLAWYERHLKGRADVDTGPRVEVQDSLGRWRGEEAWPPRDATTLRLTLASDGRLGPAGTPEVDVLVGQPGGDRFVEKTFNIPRESILAACATCPTFVSAPFEREMIVAGAPRVPLTLVPHADRGTLAVWTFVEKGGALTRMGYDGPGAMDLRYHTGGETATAITPGEPILARVWMDPADSVVPAGGRIVLVVTTEGWEGPTRALPFSLRTGGDASALELDVVPAEGRAPGG
ncbi:MAG TPA: CocE/NonD family hydrolase [Candidatus Thermoplasmatota archaeon]|nr:CocE/NonD family hydrolase [Candidatus Thermoplasmatota archaeon]